MFSAVALTKNADIDKYGYSGYGIGFDRKSSFSFPSGGFGQNVKIFGVDMSSSVHVDNKKKDILILKNGPTQGLEHTLIAEKMYSINFTVTNKIVIKEEIVICFLMVPKAKDSKIVAAPLCLGNVSKDWSVDNMKKSGFNGYVYDFSVDYDPIAVDNILCFLQD